jgi:zinc and cadmium transporter
MNAHEAATAIDPSALWLLVSYSAAIVLLSTLGGWLPSFVKLTHTRMQVVISFVGGLMLGIAIFHLLPHALAEVGMERIDTVTWSIMAGLLVMFFLLRAFHFHQHGPADFGPSVEEQYCEEHAHHDEPAPSCDTHEHHHAEDHQLEHHSHEGHHHAHSHPHHAGHHHGHGHGHHHHEPSHGSKNSRWIGVLIGLGLHTLLDGVALAAAVAADSHTTEGFSLWGVGVFLAILLHKPLDAISITSLMRLDGRKPRTIFFVNFGFALMVPLGAGLLILGLIGQSAWTNSIIGMGLAFSAGVFLCISLSDLLPEMEFHSHNRMRLTAALLLGILTAAAIGLLEPEHAHGDHHHDEVEHVK